MRDDKFRRYTHDGGGATCEQWVVWVLSSQEYMRSLNPEPVAMQTRRRSHRRSSARRSHCKRQAPAVSKTVKITSRKILVIDSKLIH